MNKQELREKAKLDLLLLPPSERKVQQEEIYQKFFESPEFKSADTIGMTISTSFEFDTRPIIEKILLNNQKRVVVPKIGENYQMDFYQIESLDNLAENKFGILEPDYHHKKVDADEIDLLIIPGLMFDKDNNRLGFGGGYFDRYLTRYSGPTVSLIFLQQIVDELPIDEHDRKINKVITK